MGALVVHGRTASIRKEHPWKNWVWNYAVVLILVLQVWVWNYAVVLVLVLHAYPGTNQEC